MAEGEIAPPMGADAATVRLLRDAPAYILALPPQDRRIASLAADGVPIWAIARQVGISDQAVAHRLDNLVAALSGRDVEPVETGGLGADTDPGVTGGYDPEPFGEFGE
jgi:DNA-binding NarL/FixJ family response regulator